VSGDRPRRPRPRGELEAAAHELRSSLNGIHTWAHLLQARLGASADASVRRALDGIHAGVRSHVLLIENLLESGAVERPLRKKAMSKRNDAQPEIPEPKRGRDKPRRPRTRSNEAPGGKDAARKRGDALDKTTRTGER
jgi:hypothetical protein